MFRWFSRFALNVMGLGSFKTKGGAANAGLELPDSGVNAETLWRKLTLCLLADIS
jgi:hypothetical protein